MSNVYQRTVDLAGGTGGGGGGALVVATRSDNDNPAVFTNFAALEAYTGTGPGTADAARINVADANDAEQVFAVGTLNANNQVTGITAAYIRLNNAWVSVAVNLVGSPGTNGQDGQADLSGIDDRRVPFNNNGQLADSPMRVMDNGNAFIQGITNIESGTLRVGPFIEVSERGGFLGITNADGDEFSFVDHLTPRDAASSNPRILFLTEAQNNFVIQSVATESLSSPVQFNYQPTLLARTNAFIGEVGTAVTNLRMRIERLTSPTNVIKYWPSEADWLDDTGTDFAAGVMTLDLGNTELPLSPSTELRIEMRYDSGTLLGDNNGIPAFTAVLQRGEFRAIHTEFDLRDFIFDGIVAGDNITLARTGTGASETLTVTATNPGNPVAPTTAEITRFVIRNQETSVVAPFTLSGSQTFDYHVNHPEDVQGDLVINQGSTLIANDVSATGSSHTATIDSVTLQAGQQVVFTLLGQTNEGTSVSRTFTIRAHAPAQQLFFGTSATNNPADVDTSTLSSIASRVQNSQVTTGTTSAGDYFIILLPQADNLTSITDTVLGQNVLSIFTLTENVRTIGTVSYKSYVVGPLNAGGSETYTLGYNNG